MLISSSWDFFRVQIELVIAMKLLIGKLRGKEREEMDALREDMKDGLKEAQKVRDEGRKGVSEALGALVLNQGEEAMNDLKGYIKTGLAIEEDGKLTAWHIKM